MTCTLQRGHNKNYVIVHQLEEGDYEFYSTVCGRAVTRPEIHLWPQPVTCLWCLAQESAL